MSIEIGQPAPDFTLVNQDNEKVTLSELKGSPVVLVFFPHAFSGTCTAENCTIRDDYSSWMDKGAKVFGISRDSRFSLAAFRKAESLTHTLLSDMNGEVARSYDAWNPGGWANRKTVVINSDGNVVLTVESEMSQQRDHSAVEAALA
ncbi:MAG: redoxin domain-containing protein [Dehalococcoidia bacterium]